MPHSINFLEHLEPEGEQQHHQDRRRWSWCLVLLVVVGVVWIGWSAIMAGRVVAAALDGRDALLAARDAALKLDFDRAKEELTAADQYFGEVEDGLGSFRWMKALPWVGTQVAAGERIVVVGRSLVGVMQEAIELGAELMRLAGLTDDMMKDLQEGIDVSLNFNELSSETKRAVLQRLSGAASDLVEMSADIELALDELDAAQVPGLAAPILDVLLSFEKKLRDARDALYTISIAAVILPEFGGLGDPTDLLLLFMNNAELRPSGGFIGTYGVMRVKDGEILELTTRDAYHLDQAADPFVNVTPPEALRAYNATNEWYFRDSNWSPDFAVAAQEALGLFQSEVIAIPADRRSSIQSPVSVEGVVGFTPTFASDILKITGPIQIGAQTFEANNIVDTLEYQVERGFDEQGLPFSQRKEIIADLVNEVKARLYALPLLDWVRVFDAIASNVDGKQLVFYSADADTQEALTQVGWAGRMTSDSVDTLLVVDANLASLKSDPAALREIFYEIDPSAEGFVATATIRYTHQGSFDWKTTRYRTYTRVFVPLGSVLLDSSGSLRDDKIKNPSGEEGQVDVSEELGFTTFGAFTSVEPGETQELRFHYLLPKTVSDAIASETYSLTVLKQIGAAEHGLTLDLDFGKKVATATPAELEHFFGDESYAGAFGLQSDVTVEVGFE